MGTTDEDLALSHGCCCETAVAVAVIRGEADIVAVAEAEAEAETSPKALSGVCSAVGRP